MTSATERFKNRARPTVAARTDELSASMQSMTSPSPASDIPTSVPTVEENQPVKQPIADHGLQTLRDELEALPKVGNFQLRVEEQYKEQIRDAADKAGVTPETLIQGLWVVAQAKPGLLDEAIVEAKEHHKRRERASVLKVAITRATKALQNLANI